jgi:hypothetical protein
MRTAIRFRAALIFAVTTALATPACYTLLKHPMVDTNGIDQGIDNRCTSCHAEDELLGYVHPIRHPPSPPEPWYEIPWWWDNYWFYAPSGAGHTPTALRGFRPDAGTDVGKPGIGGTVTPPPGPKPIGNDVRVKDPGDKGKEGKGYEGKGDQDNGNSGDGNKKENDRPVRPKGKGGKGDG